MGPKALIAAHVVQNLSGEVLGADVSDDLVGSRVQVRRGSHVLHVECDDDLGVLEVNLDLLRLASA